MNGTLCLIPARGGSKRLPRKNVLPLAGKPLLSYTIAAARESGCFDEIVVSSDDDEILALASQASVTADRRPSELAGDKVRFVEVLEEFLLRESNPRYDHIAVLLPTCPFRTADDLRASFALYRASGGFVIGVAEYEFPPQFALHLGADGHSLAMQRPEVYHTSTQSQSVPKSYHPNGAIYLGSTARFLAEKTFFAPPLHAYVMPPERSLDIDYPHQFAMAESLIFTQRP